MDAAWRQLTEYLISRTDVVEQARRAMPDSLSALPRRSAAGRFVHQNSAFAWFLFVCGMITGIADIAFAQYSNIDLDLPQHGVSNRAALTGRIEARSKKTVAELEGPGCIRHISVTLSRNDNDNRNVIIRIFFDDEKVPYVEAPLGDFFGVMHGKAWYPVNTALLSVQAKSGYNCYFPMPFAKSARVEFEVGERPQSVFCQVDWHRYPDQPLPEKRRFCARWRREFPTQRYGEDFFMLDADGPGQLVGFVYGVRLIDNTDRWSHGGADNIYIDGDGQQPAYLRGIGGEDAFGASYGGATHVPGTHLNAEMPYYVHVDVGDARPAQTLVGYRWFLNDAIHFRRSIHMRFGCMSNDICSTVYWYQEKPVRPFFRLPDFAHLVPVERQSDLELPRGSHDLPLPEGGQWWVSAAGDAGALNAALTTPLELARPFDAQGWTNRAAMHGFLDFGHVHHPERRGAGVFHEGAASARCVLHALQDGTARFQLAWDDRLVLRVNDGQPLDLGHHNNFGKQELNVSLKKGKNVVVVTLSNTRNFNHGGWAFALRATAADGSVLIPRTE